jgi:hypothetical protein
MEAASSFLTEDRVAPLVRTTVARNYLASVKEQSPRNTSRSDAGPTKVDSFRQQVGEPCLLAALAVERVLNQLGDCADRTVLSRGGGIAFIFLGGSKYAMLECDEEGALVALLSDRASASEAETWVVEPGGLTAAVRKIRSFLGAPHAAHP